MKRIICKYINEILITAHCSLYRKIFFRNEYVKNSGKVIKKFNYYLLLKLTYYKSVHVIGTLTMFEYGCLTVVIIRTRERFVNKFNNNNLKINLVKNQMTTIQILQCSLREKVRYIIFRRYFYFLQDILWLYTVYVYSH